MSKKYFLIFLCKEFKFHKSFLQAEKQMKIRENYFFLALTSFVNDSLFLEVLNVIKRKKELNECYYYELLIQRKMY